MNARYSLTVSVGWIPVSLANAPQCDIIMNEIIGVRKAMKNAFSKTYAYRANN